MPDNWFSKFLKVIVLILILNAKSLPKQETVVIITREPHRLTGLIIENGRVVWKWKIKEELNRLIINLQKRTESIFLSKEVQAIQAISYTSNTSNTSTSNTSNILIPIQYILIQAIQKRKLKRIFLIKILLFKAQPNIWIIPKILEIKTGWYN